MEKIINHKKNLYVIKQQIFEPNELFFERVNFILKNIDNIDNIDNINNDLFENLIKKSLLVTNNKNYGCEYS